jgi:N-acetylmuramic acid 6-phosphate etherase
MLNDEDAKVPAAVAAEIPSIALAVEALSKSLSSGGRMHQAG